MTVVYAVIEIRNLSSYVDEYGETPTTSELISVCAEKELADSIAKELNEDANRMEEEYLTDPVYYVVKPFCLRGGK